MQADVLAQLNALRNQASPPRKTPITATIPAASTASFASTLGRAFGRSSVAAVPGSSPDGQSQMLQAIDSVARGMGLGEEGVRVVHAVVTTEGALGGQVGDKALGGSYGPLQLNWSGQLKSLAADLGMTNAQAASWVQAHPVESVQWALRPDRYLGKTIRAGVAAGLSGPALATYAQREGQRSVSPERAGAAYQRLYGGSPA